MKKVLSMILVVILLFGALPLTVSAADADAAAAGSIHEGIVNGFHWTFDDSTGVLTIEGSGWLTLPQSFAQDKLPNRGASLRKVVIGEGITAVGEKAFEGTHYLEEVVLPSTLYKIGRSAFSGCADLTTINFPSGLDWIDSLAFSHCWSLTSVTLNEGLELIDSGAFNRTGLTSVTIPATVTVIRSCAFGYGMVDGKYSTIPGFVIYGYKDSEAETYAENNNFTFRSLIDSVDVTVNEPIAGQKPSFIASVPDGADYNANIFIWMGQQGIFLSEFEPDKDYQAGINVSVKDGYAFDPDRSQLPGKLNGVDCTFTVSSENNAYLYYKFTCPPFCTLSGNFTSYLNTPGITIELLQDGVQKYSASYQDDCGSYTLHDVSPVSYTLRVSKKNHVTRDYEIDFNGADMDQDVTICPIGDTDNDGTVSSTDAMMAYRKGMDKLELDAYQSKCADADKDDAVTSTDAMLIYRHAMGKSSLFT